MGIRDLLFVGVLAGGVAAVAAGLYPQRLGARSLGRQSVLSADPGLADSVKRVNESFRLGWEQEGLEPAPPAPELAVIRRLALGLTGMTPSLQEVRALESLPAGERVSRYVNDLLKDRRFSDYFAERLARAYVGSEGGPFLVFRRRRFVSWLSDRLLENQPYDRIVKALIASNGLWTDNPGTNFLTVTYDPKAKAVDPERVAGRVARAFLGVRIDCAQCHDHPFAPWTQHDFQGLSAFFAQTRSGLTGVHDETSLEYRPVGRKSGLPAVVAPRVPFLPELLPDATSRTNRRVRIAQWVTDPRNPNLARATVNRVWGLLTGRPLVEPVDDLASAGELPQPLNVLADDFAANGFDLKRLIRAIAATDVFRLDSASANPPVSPSESRASERSWAVFPLTRLRPEQIVGGLVQAGSLTTVDAGSPVLLRLIRYQEGQRFIKRYGDSGEDELDGGAATIPQRLQLMNGDLVRDRTRSNPLNAGTQIAYFAPDNRSAVETAYLITLTRRPGAEERSHFEAKFGENGGGNRARVLSDLVWTLVNSTEFSWNH